MKLRTIAEGMFYAVAIPFITWNADLIIDLNPERTEELRHQDCSPETLAEIKSAQEFFIEHYEAIMREAQKGRFSDTDFSAIDLKQGPSSFPKIDSFCSKIPAPGDYALLFYFLRSIGIDLPYVDAQAFLVKNKVVYYPFLFDFKFDQDAREKGSVPCYFYSVVIHEQVGHIWWNKTHSLYPFNDLQYALNQGVQQVCLDEFY